MFLITTTGPTASPFNTFPINSPTLDVSLNTSTEEQCFGRAQRIFSRCHGEKGPCMFSEHIFGFRVFLLLQTVLIPYFYEAIFGCSGNEGLMIAENWCYGSNDIEMYPYWFVLIKFMFFLNGLHFVKCFDLFNRFSLKNMHIFDNSKYVGIYVSKNAWWLFYTFLWLFLSISMSCLICCVSAVLLPFLILHCFYLTFLPWVLFLIFWFYWLDHRLIVDWFLIMFLND